MTRLTAEEVFNLVREEMAYGDQFDCRQSSPPDRICHDDKPLEQWLLWMEGYLAEARRNMTVSKDKPAALANLRVVLSLGFNAAMRLGLPPRRLAAVEQQEGRLEEIV